MAQHPDLPWLSLTDLSPCETTLGPEVAANVLLLAAHAVALALCILEAQMASEPGYHALKHMTRAQDEVKAAQAWQARAEG